MQEPKPEVVNPVPAATVVLVRQFQGRLQVYLLKRSAGSGFMAGYYVFPGGVLDLDDWRAEQWRICVDLGLEDVDTRLGGGMSPEAALAYGVAAVRETLEEAGVFLAHRPHFSPGDLEKVAAARGDKGQLAGGFGPLVRSGGWTLRLSALVRWSRWITPRRMKKHFDTRFFLAEMPQEQVCRPDRYETTHGLWVSPRQGLSDNLSGKIPLSPPTLVTLHQLLDVPDLAFLRDTAAGRPWADAVHPRLVPSPVGAVIVEPWDPEYHHPEIKTPAEPLSGRVAEVGEPFSRIWHDAGVWRPVRA